MSPTRAFLSLNSSKWPIPGCIFWLHVNFKHQWNLRNTVVSLRSNAVWWLLTLLVRSNCPAPQLYIHFTLFTLTPYPWVYPTCCRVALHAITISPKQSTVSTGRPGVCANITRCLECWSKAMYVYAPTVAVYWRCTNNCSGIVHWLKVIVSGKSYYHEEQQRYWKTSHSGS